MSPTPSLLSKDIPDIEVSEQRKKQIWIKLWNSSWLCISLSNATRFLPFNYIPLNPARWLVKEVSYILGHLRFNYVVERVFFFLQISSATRDMTCEILSQQQQRLGIQNSASKHYHAVVSYMEIRFTLKLVKRKKEKKKVSQRVDSVVPSYRANTVWEMFTISRKSSNRISM